jgi:phospholipid/cholesterol/gamma-HCH transport system substrate-binding protein
MRKVTPAMTVGLVVIGTAVIFVYLFGTVQRSSFRGDESYRLRAILDDVAGLAPQSRITMAGLPVGEIESIELDPESKRKALVWLRIHDRVVLYEGERDATGRLTNGAVLTRRQASLLGDYYLDIAPGAAGPVIPPEGEIPTVVSVSGLAAILEEMEDTGEIFSRLDEIVKNIQEVTRSLAAVTGGEAGATRLDTVLQDIAASSANVAAATADLKTFLRDTIVARQSNIDAIILNVERFTNDVVRTVDALDGSLQRTAHNIEAVSGTARDVLDRNAGKVDRILTGVEVTLGELRNSIAILDGALQNIQHVAEQVRGGQGTLGRLVTDSQLADSLEDTVSDVSGIVRSFATLETRVDLRVEYGVLGENAKTYFGLRLQPRYDRWYQIELVNDPRGKTRYTSVLTETNDPTLPPLVRESRTTTTDDLKFSLYFAKRFHFLVGRLGIIESTGGAGLDVMLFNDALRLAVDAFAFGEDRIPRFRSSLNWLLFDHLLVTAGVDDILDGRHRDYFFGLGLTFTDHDLKALLTVAPTPAL